MSRRVEVIIRVNSEDTDQVRSFVESLNAGEIVREKVLPEQRDDLDTPILEMDWADELSDLSFLVEGVNYALAQGNSDAVAGFEKLYDFISKRSLQSLGHEAKRNFPQFMINELHRTISRYSDFKTRPITTIRRSSHYAEVGMVMNPAEARCLILAENLDGMGMAGLDVLSQRERLSTDPRAVHLSARTILSNAKSKLYVLFPSGSFSRAI